MSKTFSLLFWFLLVTMILLGSCDGNNCPSEEVGQQDLASSSLLYLPYTMGQKVNFQAESGARMEFEVEEVLENGRLCVEYVCELTADPFQPQPCKYFKSEGRRQLLRNADRSQLIEIVLNVENYREESRLFFDLMSINFSGISTYARGFAATHIHFDEPEFDFSSTSFQPAMERIENLDLCQKTYENIWELKGDQANIYFKEGVGILAFFWEGRWWCAE